MITMRFDGSYIRMGHRNLRHSGLICYGWVIENDAGELATGFGVLAHPMHASSSLAEFHGLIEGLRAIKRLGFEKEDIHVVGDAESIIFQMCGESKAKDALIQRAYSHAVAAASCFEKISWEWVPRDQNQKADRLSRLAFEKARKHSSSFGNVAKNLYSCGKKKKLIHSYPYLGLPIVSVVKPQYAYASCV